MPVIARLFELQPIRIQVGARSAGTRHSTCIIWMLLSLHFIEGEGHALLLFLSHYTTPTFLLSHQHSLLPLLHLPMYPRFPHCEASTILSHWLPLPSSARDKLLSVTLDAKRTTNHAPHKPAPNPRCLYRNPGQRCFPQFCDREILQSTSSSNRVSPRQCRFHSS